MSIYRKAGAAIDDIKFKLFLQDQTVPLSDALPMLENMGLRVVGEQPHQLTLEDGCHVWINDFSMTYATEPTFEVEEVEKESPTSVVMLRSELATVTPLEVTPAIDTQ